MTEDGEKKKKDLVITKHTGLPFDCDLYDRSPWKCAEGIFFLEAGRWSTDGRSLERYEKLLCLCCGSLYFGNRIRRSCRLRACTGRRKNFQCIPYREHLYHDEKDERVKSMKYQWKKGMSLSFFQNEKRESIGADPEILREVGEHGFDCVELSFSHDEYFYKYRFTEEENAEKLASYCKESGLEIWSIHLPFSEKWDLSNDDAEEALADDRKLIEAAEKAGIRVAVIHPSFEPIPEADRAKRIENAKKNLKLLNQTAKEHGIVLALENLPRTCLGNHSEEMIELLKATGTSFIFDTNHSLDEDNVEFLRNMIAHGYCPVSLHISDYDFIDERHDLPGHGINQWGKLLDLLENAGYSGPALYEIRHVVSEERIISFDEVTENINSLLNGDIK